jgi:putative intracellular protease/amidase
MTAIRDSKILIIATNGFEQSELEVPRDKFKAAGAKVTMPRRTEQRSKAGSTPTGDVPPAWT